MMDDKPKLPEPEIIDKTVNNLRSVCQQLDTLTLQLDELIAMVEADIRRSPLTTYRLKKGMIKL
jgi:hypothetical protein